MKKWLPIGIVAGVILIMFFSAIAMYNGLITKQEEVKAAWSQVENQYQRRFDLIPNVVKTVMGFAKQEREILTEVARLRSQWGQARSSGDILQAQESARGLDGALSRLLLVVERYPDLKSNQNFLRLQDQLEGIENRISVERRRYNLAVQSYNVATRRFPTSIMASTFGFERMVFFEAEGAAKEVPKVSL